MSCTSSSALSKQEGFRKPPAERFNGVHVLRAFLEGVFPSSPYGKKSFRHARRLRRRQRTSPHRDKAAPTQDEIEVFIARRLSSQLGIPHEEVDLQQPFSALGLDSASALTFLGDLETWLDRRLASALTLLGELGRGRTGVCLPLFWNYPTVAALAKHLGETGPDERNRTKWTP